MKSETLFNISLVSFIQNSFDVWAWKPLLADDIIVSDFFSLHLKFLIDTGATGYFFINERLANQVYKKLQIAHIRLNWLKSVKGYNDQVTSKFIIHIIYSTLTVEDHKKLIASIFIMCLGHQDTILESSWMTHHSVWPDLINHSIVFISHFCDHFEADYS